MASISCTWKLGVEIHEMNETKWQFLVVKVTLNTLNVRKALKNGKQKVASLDHEYISLFRSGIDNLTSNPHQFFYVKFGLE
jgi:hypothetical protein